MIWSFACRYFSLLIVLVKKYRKDRLLIKVVIKPGRDGERWKACEQVDFIRVSLSTTTNRRGHEIHNQFLVSDQNWVPLALALLNLAKRIWIE